MKDRCSRKDLRFSVSVVEVKFGLLKRFIWTSKIHLTTSTGLNNTLNANLLLTVSHANNAIYSASTRTNFTFHSLYVYTCTRAIHCRCPQIRHKPKFNGLETNASYVNYNLHFEAHNLWHGGSRFPLICSPNAFSSGINFSSKHLYILTFTFYTLIL